MTPGGSLPQAVQVAVVDRYFIERASLCPEEDWRRHQVYGPVAAEIVCSFLQEAGRMRTTREGRLRRWWLNLQWAYICWQRGYPPESRRRTP